MTQSGRGVQTPPLGSAATGRAEPEHVEATLEPDPSARNGRAPSPTMSINASDVQARQAMMLARELRPHAHLLVCMGANVGHRYAISSNEYTIGRSPGCDVRVDDDRVSSRHAEIVRRGDQYRIYDLGSSNGTLVNAQRIDEIDLRDGDLVQVGYTVFKYQIADGANERRGQSGAIVRAPEAPGGPGYPPGYGAPPYGMPPPGMAMQPYGYPPGYGGPLGYPQPPPGYGMPMTSAMATGMPQPQRSEAEDASIQDLWAQAMRVVAFFRPYWRSIAGVVAGCVVVGIISYWVLPPPNSAYFEVELRSKANTNVLDKTDTTDFEFFKSAATTFRSPTLIEKTYKALNEPVTLSDIQATSNLLSFDNQNGTGSTMTYRGTMRAENEEFALKFLIKHVELFFDEEINRGLSGISTRVDFLRGEAAKKEAEMRETESKVTEFKKANIDALPEQAREYMKSLADLQRRETDADIMSSRLAAEASVDSRKLNTSERMIDSSMTSSRSHQQAITQKNQLLAQKRAEGLGDNHPDIMALQREIDELKTLAERSVTSGDDVIKERKINDVYVATEDRLQRLRAGMSASYQEKQKLKQEYERIKGVVAKLPELEAQYAELTRNQEVTRKFYQDLTAELSKVQLQYSLEKASANARYQVITNPQLEPIKPVKQIGKRAGLALIVGAVLGLLQAAVRQLRKVAAEKAA